MSDTPTDIPGISVRTVAKPGSKNSVHLLLIDVKKAFEENPPRPPVKLGRLATTMWLNDLEVFHAITANNQTAMRSLFQAGLKKTPAGPTLTEAEIAELKAAAAVFKNGTTEHVCADWEVRGSEIEKIVLPETTAFEDFLARQAIPGARAKHIRMSVLNFDLNKFKADLRAQLQRLRELSALVNVALESMKRHIGERSTRISDHAAQSQDAGALGDLAVLNMIEGALGVTIEHPKEAKKKGSDDEKKLQELLKRVRHLKAVATDCLIQHPLSNRAILDDLKKKSQDLKNQFEDVDFQGNIDRLVKNADLFAPQPTVVPAGVNPPPPKDDPIWGEVTDTLIMALAALLGTDHVDEIVDDHVIPLMDLLAFECEQDFSKLVLDNRPLFLKALKEKAGVPKQPKAGSVVTKYGASLTIISSLVGNTPGPSTFSIAVMQIYMSWLVKRHVKISVQNGDWDFAAHFAAKTLKSFFRTTQKAQLTEEEMGRIAKAFGKNNDLSELYKISWPRKMMSSGTWGGAMGILNVVALLSTIAESDFSPQGVANSLVNIGSALSGVFLDTAQILKAAQEAGAALSKFGRAFNAGVFKVPMSAAAKAAGSVAVEVTVADLVGAAGSILMIWSGFHAAREASKQNDNTGMYIGIATATAGALSLIGFILATGCIAGATGIGAPLMAIGAILAAGVAVFAIVRDLTTPGGQLVFQTFLDYFNRDAKDSNIPGVRLPQSTFKDALSSREPETAAARKELSDAFDAIANHKDLWKFYPANVDVATIPLREIGYDVDQIALITGEDFLRVSAILRAEEDKKFLGSLSVKVVDDKLGGGVVTIKAVTGKANVAQRSTVGRLVVFDAVPQGTYSVSLLPDNGAPPPPAQTVNIIGQKSASLAF